MTRHEHSVIDQRLSEAKDFVIGGTGVAVVRRAGARAGLPASLDDDIVSDAMHRLERRLRRGDPIDNVEAMLTVMIRRSALDLVRGRRTRPHEVNADLDLPTGRQRTTSPRVAPELDHSPVDALPAWAEALRQRVLDDAGGDPRLASMALTALSIEVDGAIVGEACPTPAGHGAPASDASLWAAVWYSGGGHLAGGADEHSNRSASRQRQRLVATLRQFLAELVGRGLHHG